MRVIYDFAQCYAIIEFEPFSPYYMDFKKMRDDLSKWQEKFHEEVEAGTIDTKNIPTEVLECYGGELVAYWMNLVNPEAKAKYIKWGTITYKKRKALRKYRAVYEGLTEEEKRYPIIFH